MWRCATACLLILLALRPASAQERLAIPTGGYTREAIVYTSPSAQPRPLLILLHGRFGTGAQVLRSASLRAQGYVLVAPDGVDRAWASGGNATPADRAGVDDIAFLRTRVAEMVRRYRVDPARVYIAGMSNGGFMAARVACEAPDLVAGIAIVSATTGGAATLRCVSGRPVSVLLIHGSADPLVRAEGVTMGRRGHVLGSAEAARFWAARQGCVQESVARPLPHAGAPDATQAWRTDFGPCRGGARVAFIDIRGGGHAWPGARRGLSGSGSQAIDGGTEIERFFGLAAN